MSQSKRSHVRALTRWREQAARLVPVADQDMVKRGRFAQGQWCFDVDRVRFCCEWVVAAAERRALDREVFIDWTRTKGPQPCGLGPENRTPGAFSHAGWVGGWPGRLADEWSACVTCHGTRSIFIDCLVCNNTRTVAAYEVETDKWAWTWPCKVCRGTGHNLGGVLPSVELPRAARRWKCAPEEELEIRHQRFDAATQLPML
jgi:hypothetical protein